jgi:hypothetical protein
VEPVLIARAETGAKTCALIVESALIVLMSSNAGAVSQEV